MLVLEMDPLGGTETYLVILLCKALPNIVHLCCCCRCENEFEVNLFL